MNQLEIFRATVNHDPHNQFLYYAHFVEELAGRVREKYRLEPERNIEEQLGMLELYSLPLNGPQPPAPDVFAHYFTDTEKPEGSFINTLGVLEIPARFYHFTGYVSPLRNAREFSEIKQFPFPEAEGYSEAEPMEKVADLHRRGRVAAAWIGHNYEDSWQVRGYEEFLMDMVDRPEWCEYILDRFMERNLKKAIVAARAGADMIITGDDVANQKSLMFAPDTWRCFLKPRWLKVYQAARRIKPNIQIWYHSDGNIAAIIPDLIEIGVTVLNPVQPECMDVLDLKKKYGKYLVFDGTIGTQTTMPFGTPADVKKVVRERKKTIGADGGLILSPTHVLEPEVPLENIAAFLDACQEE